MNAATLQKVGLTATAVYAAGYAAQSIAMRELKHFTPAEFGIWFPLIDQDLLWKLDAMRDYLNTRIMVSPAPGSIGRITPGAEASQHYPSPFVNALDLMIPGVSLQDQETAARVVGFTGIGLYPMWKPYPGIHVDNRKTQSVATWSGFPGAAGSGRQRYAGIAEAYA